MLSAQDHIRFVGQHVRGSEIFTAGIACHALVLLERSGVLRQLQSKNGASATQLERRLPDRLRTAVRGAFRALQYAQMLERTGDYYQLTTLGLDAMEHMGEFMLIFSGYANLLAKSCSFVEGAHTFSPDDVNGSVVAEASMMICADAVDRTAHAVLSKLSPRGTICDLGCGSGKRLLDACAATGNPGIGFDVSPGAVAYARRMLEANPTQVHVEIHHADVTRLEGCWPEVDILMQAFLMHHIVPDERCIGVLRSYAKAFPNARYLLILDTTTAENDEFVPIPFVPGFDYVHRLQGLEPRSRTEALSVFSSAGYRLVRELPLGLPNTFLWLLQGSP